MMTSAINTNESALYRWIRRSYALVLVLVGAAMIYGGVMLMAYGGSLYYFIAGLALGSSGILIWRRDPRGAWIYSVKLGGTLAWAILHVGFDTWGLVARLTAPLVLGVPLLLRAVRPVGAQATALRGVRGWPVCAAGFGGALLLGVGLHALGTTHPIDPLLQRGTVHAPERLAHPFAAITGRDLGAFWSKPGGGGLSPLTPNSPPKDG